MVNIYCINLDHRTDRWAECTANYEEHGLSLSAVRRWSAVSQPEFGALGCAKSHVAVLAHFLSQSNAQHCLVLEDDFDFVRPWNELAVRFDQVVAQRIEWDVLLLMGTAVGAYPPSSPGIARVFQSQSTAGYLVGRKYAPLLLGCFAESIPELEAFHGTVLQNYCVTRSAIDVGWQALQRRDRWYIFSPAFGRQRESYSDVEGIRVNYDTFTYGLEERADATSD